jgi:uncharacterized protein
MKTSVVALVVGFLLAVVGVALGAGWLRNSPSDSRTPHVITVTGEARLVGEPDLARVMFGVTKNGPTVREPQRVMSKTISKVIAAEQARLNKEDISTSDISISQGWDYRKKRPSGFTVSNTLVLTVRDVQHVGDIIDIAVANGMNRLQGVNYDVSSVGWKQKAMEEALAKAHEKALAMASGAGRTLGPAVSIREGDAILTSPEDEYYDKTRYFSTRSQARSAYEYNNAPASLSFPGQYAMTARVEVAYELK